MKGMWSSLKIFKKNNLRGVSPATSNFRTWKRRPKTFPFASCYFLHGIQNWRSPSMKFATDPKPRHINLWPLHCAENPIYVFPEIKLCSLVPNSDIHVSVSDLYIPKTGLPILLHQNWQTEPGNIKIAYRCRNVEIGRQNIIILFWK